MVIEVLYIRFWLPELIFDFSLLDKARWRTQKSPRKEGTLDQSKRYVAGGNQQG